MIYDTLSSLGTYSCIPHVGELVEFLAGTDIAAREPGSYPVIGQDLVLKKIHYVPADSANDRFEVHHRYADLQMVLGGREIIRTVFPGDATRLTEYDGNDDAEFFSADKNCTEFILEEGRFLYLAPGEIHRPACPCGDYRGEVVKCVFKIKCP